VLRAAPEPELVNERVLRATPELADKRKLMLPLELADDEDLRAAKRASWQRLLEGELTMICGQGGQRATWAGSGLVGWVIFLCAVLPVMRLVCSLQLVNVDHNIPSALPPLAAIAAESGK
jgi:hypothetical protein